MPRLQSTLLSMHRAALGLVALRRCLLQQHRVQRPPARQHPPRRHPYPVQQLHHQHQQIAEAVSCFSSVHLAHQEQHQHQRPPVRPGLLEEGAVRTLCQEHPCPSQQRHVATIALS